MEIPTTYKDLKLAVADQWLGKPGTPRSFDSLRKDFSAVFDMIKEIAFILESSIKLPTQLFTAGETIVSEFLEEIAKMGNYSYVADSPENIVNKNNIVKDVKKILDIMLLADQGIYGTPLKNFLNVYNAIISLSSKETGQELLREEITKALEVSKEIIGKIIESNNELTEAKEKYDALLIDLQNTGKEISLQDYSKIFNDEATTNAKLASKWFTASICAIACFVIFVFLENWLIPISSDPRSTVITLEYFRRLLFISFFIYVITFLLKQYSIRRHLETVNKHRAKTLQSYKLFLESIDTASADIKNTLMVEVARAIYESGQTGYLPGKNDSNSTPSIMEITKYISQVKQ